MNITKIEHFGIQRKMVASVTTDSWQHIPHISYIYEPEVSALFEEYKKINAQRPAEKKITFNTVMIKVLVEGIKAAPLVNSHIEYNHRFAKGKITTFENINISMPTILPNGEMMTTNLRDFHNKSIDQMSDYIADLQRRAKESNLTECLYSVSYNKTLETIKKGKLVQAVCRIVVSKTGKNRIRLLKGKQRKEYFARPETERLGDKDIEQGTVTISNIGSLSRTQRGTAAMLEVIPPQVAVFCIGAIQDKPVVKTIDGEKKVVPGKVLPICMGLDHRAMDFGDAVPMIERLDDIFANPQQLHQWLD